jgi:uncharacterized protein YhdP
LHKKTGRRMTLFLSILLLGSILIAIGMRAIAYKVNQNQEKIVNILKTAGVPIIFKTLEAKWFGLSLGLSVQQVAILDDSVNPIPLIEIENITLFPGLSSLLFNPQFDLKKIKFTMTNFKYASGWPQIESARGRVIVKNDRVTVKFSAGSIMGAVIDSARVDIVRVDTDEKPTVFVTGALDSTLERGLLFLQQSPLKTLIADQLAALNPKGSMHLDLKCDIPLDTRPVKVDGSVLVKNGRCDVPGWNLEFSGLKGSFDFTDQGLTASNVVASLDGLPLNLNIKTTGLEKQKNKVLEMTFNSRVSVDFFKKHFTHALLEKFQGEALFSLVLKKPLEASAAKKTDLLDWVLTSDLQGIKIDLPDFLGKSAAEPRKMILKIGDLIKGERKFIFQIPNRLDVKFVTANSGDHLVLKNVDLLIGRLDVYGLQLDKTRVVANFAALPVKWHLDGPVIQGSFTEANGSHQQATIDLAYLKILAPHLDSETQSIPHSLTTAVKVPISFYCKDLQYEKSNFGEISFNLVPASFGYRIQNLLVETPLSELSGNGEWHLGLAGGRGVYTTLQGKMTTVNMGATLSRWDYPTGIRESSGFIQYQFRWPKHPFQFKLGIVDGTAELKFDKGRILGVNPGIGRIMGLLNLENIRRRLQLDFSDLVKTGFVFDTLKANFRFRSGIAKTEKLVIDGPSAKITLAGEANMNTKGIRLDMTVRPHMGVGIPLAAAIAVGNPAVGAGLWIIDKLTGSKINKITEHRYQVTGTWDLPSIAEATTRPR